MHCVFFIYDCVYILQLSKRCCGCRLMHVYDQQWKTNPRGAKIFRLRGMSLAVAVKKSCPKIYT